MYSARELMVAVAARQIRDGETVFVGMRLPLLAFAVAKMLHAPNAMGLFENGVVRDTPPSGFIVTMGDPPNINQAAACTGLLDVMGWMQAGRVNLGFIGGAEIDRHGNLNTTLAGGERPVRLPGSGGGADIACLAQRTAIIMNHEPRRFTPRVRYVTSPGLGDGAGWRQRVGLHTEGPRAVITTLCVLAPDEHGDELVVASLHPGVSFEQVVANTGWPVRAAPTLTKTMAPSQDELDAIRAVDPTGFWTGGAR